ncbi:RNA recognition motif domain-containing protein [Nitrospira sp. Nam80]
MMGSTLLYVGGLTEPTTAENLRELCAPFGVVEWAHIVTHKFSGKTAGYGFVEMDTDDHALDAARTLEGTERHGLRLRVYITPSAHQRV